MGFDIKEKLEESDRKGIIAFLDSLDFYCLEQHPDWNTQIETYPRKYLIGTDNNGVINCFGNIIFSQSKFKIATLHFGPAFSDYKVLEDAIRFLHKYFTSHNFIEFSVQLGTYINNRTELLEYYINRDFRVKYIFNSNNTWTSISVDLQKPVDEIFRSIHRSYRARINHGSRDNLRVTFDNNPDNLKALIELYIKMEKVRNLSFNYEDVVRRFHRVNDFLYKTGNGFFEYIFQENVLVGGLVIFYQGKIARVYKSATDHDRRDISIKHFGLFEAMKFCKEKGIEKLDLWGYNHLVNKNDQIFNINIFKKSFGGEFTFFPKRMNFILKPRLYYIYTLFKKIKNRVKR